MPFPDAIPSSRWLVGLAFGALVGDRVRLARRQAAAALLVREHAALHEVAAAVARGAALEEVCERAAESATVLLGGEVGLVLRFDEAGRGVLVGRSRQAIARYPTPGQQMPFEPGSAIDVVRTSRRPARVAAGAPSPFRRQLGERVAAPIELEGRLWGAVAVGGTTDRPLPAGCEGRLESFAELVALAIGNAEARAQLIAQATTDPLTGLANRRAFSARLEEETARAGRYGRALSLILFDVDHFKAVNDGAGHHTGDLVLVEVAARILEATRTEAQLARLGGDEIVAIAPECDAEAARRVAERALAAVQAQPICGRAVTLSAGVAALGESASGICLLERADQALYRAKAAGRGRVSVSTAGPGASAFGAESPGPLRSLPPTADRAA